MFIKTSTIKKKNKEYKYYSIVQAIWKDGKAIHKVIASLGAISKNKAELIKEILSSDKPSIQRTEKIFPQRVYEFLAVAVVEQMFRYWDLEEVLLPLGSETTKFPYLQLVKILLINRCLEPKSKLQVPLWYGRTFLERLTCVSAKELDEDILYRTMDALLPLEKDIQKYLYEKIKEKYPKSFRLVFYDLTSSYFEGISCPIAKYGYSRDHRSDKLQIVLGLVVTEEGFPFYWEVFYGNQADVSTLSLTVNKLKEEFSISSFALVMDRGLVSKENISCLEGRINYIMLSDIPKDNKHPINIEVSHILSTFTQENLSEKLNDLSKYSDELYYKELSTFNGQRNILCFAPKKYLDNKDYRENVLKEVETYLKELNEALSKAKRNRDYGKIDKHIDRYLKHKKVSRFLTYKLIGKNIHLSTKKGEREISTFELSYSRNQESIDKASIFDGAYLLISDLTQKFETKNEYTFSPDELIKAYKRRGLIEQSFRVIKSFIRLRPIYHRLEDRVRSHVLLCILSYLLDTTISYLLEGKIDKEIWAIYNILNECKLVEFSIGEQEDTISKITPINSEQIEILELLGCKHLISPEFIRSLNT